VGLAWIAAEAETLHLWAESDAVDPVLRIALDGREPVEDRDSGGGTTAYLAVELAPGARLDVTVSAAVRGPVRVHGVAERGTDASLRAQAELRELLDAVDAAQRDGELGRARDAVERGLVALRAAGPAAPPRSLARLAQRLGLAAFELQLLPACAEAWSATLASFERTLPPGHADLFAVRNNLAAARDALGDAAGARALLEEVVAALERTRPEDDPTLLAVQANLGNALLATGELDAARARLSAALGGFARTLPAGHPNALIARSGLGLVLREQGDLEGARAHLEVALEGLERALGPDHPNLVGIRYDLALTLGGLGEHDGARALLESVLAARRRAFPEGHPQILVVQGELALARKAQGELEAVRPVLEAVVAGLERSLPADDAELLAARARLGKLLREAGELEGALDQQERALDGFERTLPAWHPRRLGALRELSRTQCALGDAEGACAGLSEALAAAASGLPADHRAVVLTRVALAHALLDRGDERAARALLEAVLESQRRALPADDPALLDTRTLLAAAMARMGDFPGARAHFEAVASARAEQLPADHRERVVAELNLARTLEALDDLAGARALLESAVATLERSPGASPGVRANARSGLAIVLLRQGEHARALEQFAAVHADAQRRLPAGDPGRRRARSNYASALLESGDPEAALPHLEAVLAADEASLPEGHPDLLSARLNAAVARAAVGDVAGASALADALARGTLVGLQDAARQSSRREAARFVRNAAELNERGWQLSRSDAAPALRFAVVETMRAVAALGRAVPAGGPEDEPLRAELAEVRRRLGELLAVPPEAGAVGDAVERLSAERDRLERELRAGDGRGVRALDAAELAGALPAGAVAVGFHVSHAWRGEGELLVPAAGGDRLLAHRLDADGSLRAVDLGSVPELEREVRAWRRSLGRPVAGRGVALADAVADGAPDERGRGAALRAALLDPLLADLPDGVHTVHLCAASVVHAVPLEALPLGGAGPSGEAPPDGARLGDRLRVVRWPSFAALLERGPRPPSGAEHLLAIGGVAFDAAAAESSRPLAAEAAAVDDGLRGARAPVLVALPGTEAEVRAIADAFERSLGGESTLLTGQRATKAALHALAPGKRWLHVATHGWFRELPAEEPLARSVHPTGWSLAERVRDFTPWSACGLALAGANRGRDALGRVPGIVTAEELAGLDLSGCELAVLSACETHVGLASAGLGIESLQAALHAAGVRTAVTSLWTVDDARTRELMEAFYARLWEQGLPKAEALWRAKRDLRDRGAPVRDWAGWVLSGDPDRRYEPADSGTAR